MLTSLKSKIAGDSGEMEEPVSGDVQIFLSSKENSVSIRSLGVGIICFPYTIAFPLCYPMIIDIRAG